MRPRRLLSSPPPMPVAAARCPPAPPRPTPRLSSTRRPSTRVGSRPRCRSTVPNSGPVPAKTLPVPSSTQHEESIMHELCCSAGQTSVPRPRSSSVPPPGSPVAAAKVRPQLLGHPAPPLPQAPRGQRELAMPAASHRPYLGRRAGSASPLPRPKRRLGVSPTWPPRRVEGSSPCPATFYRPCLGLHASGERRKLAVRGRAAAPPCSSRPAAPHRSSAKLAQPAPPRAAAPPSSSRPVAPRRSSTQVRAAAPPRTAGP
ncbi:hypothetical protein C2845_PM02G19950 [Panicum miliaceum]|uniref:Uncharacterized protein n=1 Tax=Panicum miliaceum TaxID=4540 RepID=A0A3L6SDG7_PANMI|nr:hypothetical protein C2845_PM02G19950 [Panicum miliaceum]